MPRRESRINTYNSGELSNRSIAFDPSGILIVTAGEDGFARLFAAWLGGAPILVLPTGGVPIRDAAFGREGFAVATVGTDGRVRIWDSSLSRSELAARDTRALYPQVTAAVDGSRYLFGSTNLLLGLPADQPAVIEVIDAATGDSLISRPAIKDWDQKRRPAISNAGSLVAFAGPSGNVEIVGVDTGVTIVIPESAGWTASLSFSPDGLLLAGGGTDGSISLWKVATGEVDAMFHGHGDRKPAHGDLPPGPSESLGVVFSGYTTLRVDGVVFRPDGTELASAGFDGTLRTWDVATGAGRVLYTFDYPVESVVYSPDGALLAAADSTGTILALDANSGEVVAVPERVSGRTELVFSPDGRFLAGAGPGPVAHLWDMGTGRIVRRFLGAVAPPQAVAFVNEGSELRVAGGEGFDRGYVLDPMALVEIARGQVTRDLTEAECEQYLRRACDR